MNNTKNQTTIIKIFGELSAIETITAKLKTTLDISRISPVMLNDDNVNFRVYLTVENANSRLVPHEDQARTATDTPHNTVIEAVNY
jgi:hypothetical protein